MSAIARKHRAPNGAHAHKLVAIHAQELAYILFNELAQDNRLFEAMKKRWPRATTTKALERAFMLSVWPRCIGASRATMAGMLNLAIDPDVKEAISEALILDRTLRKGRINPSQIIGSM